MQTDNNNWMFIIRVIAFILFVGNRSSWRFDFRKKKTKKNSFRLSAIGKGTKRGKRGGNENPYNVKYISFYISNRST